MNKNKKGVLILTPFFSPNIGGVETHLDNLVSILDEKGYKVFVQTYSPITTENIPWKKMNTLEITYKFIAISGLETTCFTN